MKRILYTLMALALVLAVTFASAAPTVASTSSVVQTLGVVPSVTYADGTLYYTVILSNLAIAGANDALVDLVFYPPGPTGAAGAFGAPVDLAIGLLLAVGDSVTFTWVGGGGDVENAGLEVDLASIPLDPGVTVVYGECEFFAAYQATPPYSARDDRDIPALIIRPDTEVSIDASPTTVLIGESVDLTITEENTGDVDLTNVYVEVYKDGSLFATLTAPADSGDAVDPGVLNVGETWTWVISSGAITGPTTFVALGFGTDPLGNVISYAEGYLDERDEVTVDILEPNTEVTIDASAYVVSSGESVDLTITESNTGDVDLINVFVDVYKDGVWMTTLIAPPDSGDAVDPGVLNVGETWTWVISSGPITVVPTTFEAYGFGTDPLGNVISYAEGYLDELDEVTVTPIDPDTMVTIDASAYVVPSGASVDLTITEENTGDVDLTNVYVEVYKDGSLFATLTAPADSGDAVGPGVLNVAETWTWTIDSGPITATTTFVALGFGTDPLGNEISYAEGFLGERDEVTVEVEELCWADETFWAYGGDPELNGAEDDVAHHNNKVEGNPANWWGWTNYMAADADFPFVMQLWAGAGQNDTTKGTLVGTLTVEYDASCVTVTYQLYAPYMLDEAHLWVGSTPLPTWEAKRGRTTTIVSTAAPGRFKDFMDYDSVVIGDQSATFVVCNFDLDADGGFWVAAHGVVLMPVPCDY